MKTLLERTINDIQICAIIVDCSYEDFDIEIQKRIVDLEDILKAYKDAEQSVADYIEASPDNRIEDITDSIGFELSFIKVAKLYAEIELRRIVIENLEIK
jgi:hypothetical protein